MALNAQPFTGENTVAEIADFIADPVAPASFPEHRLRWRNDRAAAEVGLDNLGDAEWVAHFGRFEPLPGSLPQPLALRYHGHQFRIYNPDIGDGRGFLFAQMRDAQGRLMDFGTKGSGQTPYSRFGDGRLTLKGGIREILATEMLEALGVETSRTFSLIETGEQLHRGDEPSPTRSAVMVRLSHGHIRIGSFQRLATLGLHDDLRRLTTYSLKHYYNEAGTPERLLTLVVRRTAHLAASYMAAGFVHGVLNSDNINITGESFDYGPWRFAPTFDAGFTAAYFDSAGLYAFGRQAEAIHWDVVQLAIALIPIADKAALQDAIDSFAPAYRAALVDRFLWRLGVMPTDDARDMQLVQKIETMLIETQLPIGRFFHDHAGGRLPHQSLPELADYESAIDLSHRHWQQPDCCSMPIDDVEAIWSAIADHDDWSMLNAKVTNIRQMGQALAKRNAGS